MSPLGRARRRRGAHLAAGALVLALGAPACSSGTTGSGGDSGGPITLSHGYTDAEATSIKALVAEWNAAHADNQVRLVFNSGNDNALTKTRAALAAGKYPDIAYEFGSSATALVKRKQVVDLTASVGSDAAWDWKSFFPSERAAGTVNGKVVGLPALVDNLGLVFNKALFDAAGVAYPTASWTWQDFRAAAKKLSDPAKKRFGWAYINDGSEDATWRFVALLWQAGGDLLNDKGDAVSFDSAAGVKAMTLLRDMSVQDKAVYLDTGSGNYLNLFNSGRIAMMWTGPWDLSSINENVSYGVQVLPGDVNHDSISGPDVWMVFDHGAAKVRRAKAFLQWFLSAPVHLRFATATGDLPLRSSEQALPGYAAFTTAFPGAKVFTTNLDNVHKIRPNIAAYPEVSAAIGQAVQAVLLGRATPAAALKAAAVASNDVLHAGG